MKARFLIAVLALLSTTLANAEVTLEQCVEKASANYPLIKKYNLTEATCDIDLSDINKGWLPRIGVYGQASAQNIVPSFPDALTGILHNMGQEIRGLSKLQYKIGVDVTQTIWDGGASKVRRELARSQETVQNAAIDVELYQIRQRVENLYFAILLTDEQIAQSHITYDLICSNLDKLRSMLRNGTAMQADVDMMEAQALTVNQNIVQAQCASAAYRKALAIFVGEDLENEKLTLPSAEMPADTTTSRPELAFFSRRLEYNQVLNRLSDTSLMPRIGFFAQAYYGYPGFNYFESMMNRNLSFNILAGVKVSWNIDSFYTKKNSNRRMAINAAEIEADRDVFFFNTKVQMTSQIENINGIRRMMEDDGRIIALRTNVRKAAESQMTNGVIDITALLSKISDENVAMLTSKYHEILLLQEIYKLKYTLNR